MLQDSATPKMVRNVIDGTTPPQKVVGSYEQLEDGTVVTLEYLLAEGLVSKAQPNGLKVLGNGTLTKKLTVKANKFSKSAEAKIKELGGEVEVL